MFVKIHVVFGALFLVLVQKTIAANDYHYEARVLDYNPTIESTTKETFSNNLNYYLTEIENSKGIDIIVFPEYGLTTVDIMFHANISYLGDSVVEVPKESNEEICGKNGIHHAINAFSCMAVKAKIYIVVNLLEVTKRPNVIFNTNVVFDRKGALIAKYRKINLFGPEVGLLKPGKEMKSFKTDFGVEFGIFICFDILFKNPAKDIFTQYPNVTDIIYTTAWFSETPWYTALGVQDGYAKKYGVNLLVSGYGNPEAGNGGSGFYLPLNVKRIYLPITRTKETVTSRVQLIDERQPELNCKNITKSPRFQSLTNLDGIDSFKTKSLDSLNMIETYTYINIISENNTNNRFEKLICSGKVCCKFNITYDPSLINIGPVYKAIGSNNACGIIACDDGANLTTCGSRNKVLQQALLKYISIEVIFFNHAALHYLPVSSNLALRPIDYSYCESRETVLLTTSNQQGVVHLGFIMGWEPRNSGVSSKASFNSVLLSFVMLINAINIFVNR